ncbi:hypothetical protein X798_04248 [Onchocerca flexuosa]|uniref:Dirigent protein n=2 Tax=Onchocerca flexuosa TaxID=387005 RepID=A0A183H2Z1_9BILA|nr:hypothetical protein X798_04248 [Onchocerca flexuosa]VDO31001.1 unnamed protein product [Onchocerca flexuosa]
MLSISAIHDRFALLLGYKMEAQEDNQVRPSFSQGQWVDWFYNGDIQLIMIGRAGSSDNMLMMELVVVGNDGAVRCGVSGVGGAFAFFVSISYIEACCPSVDDLFAFRIGHVEDRWSFCDGSVSRLRSISFSYDSPQHCLTQFTSPQKIPNYDMIQME